MNADPISVISVLVADQIRLRVYRGPTLAHELPLRPRQSLTLAAQLLNHALMTQDRLGQASVLQDSPQERVATKLVHMPPNGGNT
jgi:hypothetical protein